MAGDPREFTASFDCLSEAVGEACARQREWPQRVVAGIDAAVRFAAADPAAARRLAAGADEREDGDRLGQVIDHFAALLREGAPEDRPLPPTTGEALVAGIVSMFGGHLRTDRLGRLAELTPDMAYFALVPYLGFEEAKRWTGAGERVEAPSSD